MAINATLVNLHIGRFTNTRQDQDITDEVRLAKALGVESGEWRKRLLPKEALYPIVKMEGIIRTLHYKLTSPWDDGYRIITNAALASYDQQMSGLRIEWDKAVAAFGQQYEMWALQAYLMHRQTYNDADYPPWEKLRKRFSMQIEHLPVPEAGHFNQTLRGLYSEELEHLTEQRLNNAISDAWERILAPVRDMATKLASPETIFRDSLVGNIREALDIIPNLVTDTRPQFAQAVAAIKDQLANQDPDALRENRVQRRDVAMKAEAIVKKFGALGNRKFS